MLLNVNVGVLGHVDSGKTSLVRALSTQLSTAALDKHPQSQQRGITLDLGFSSFVLMGTQPSLQVTLVDCPGHASLFRTILGGVAIIDAVLLVVDCRKGMQPQTIESLLLTALAAKKRVVVALTKTDLLSCVDSEKMATIDAVTAEIRLFLATYLQVEVEAVPVVPVAVGADQEHQGIQELLEALRTNLQPPHRDTSGDFRLAVDHCFAVPGNGTVLTGTVLSGALKRGDELELLPIGVKTKVKTLQVFKQEVDRCAQGDRVGVRVNGLDPTLVERALAVSPPGSLAPVTQVVIPVTRVSFFQGAACKSGGKCHATVGHTTVIATTTFFSRLGAATEERGEEGAGFDPSVLYEYVAELDFGDKDHSDGGSNASVFALLQFEHAAFCPPNALVVCSRLDLDAKRFPCRLAFYGAVTSVVGSTSEELSGLAAVHRSVVELTELQIGRVKSREGFVDKVVAPRSGDAREVIGRDMFSKDVKWSVYQATIVLFEQARVLGTILGPFGKAGKFRIALEASTLHRSLPVPGEKFVLRFLKLMTLKPPKLKGKSATVKTAASNVKPKVMAKDNARPFLQDKDLLYPEAFTPLSTTAVKEADVETVAVETVNLFIVEAPARAHEGATTEPTTAPRSGRIERLKGETAADGRNPFAIVVGMFTSEQEAEEAVGCRVRFVHSDGVNTDFGTIEKPFGKAGKIRVEFRGGTMGQVGDSVERC